MFNQVFYLLIYCLDNLYDVLLCYLFLFSDEFKIVCLTQTYFYELFICMIYLFECAYCYC